MQVGLNPVHGTSFGAVNQKYVKKAVEDCRRGRKDVSLFLMHRLQEDVFLLKTMSIQDGRDTALALRKFIPYKEKKVYDEFFQPLYA